MARPAKGYRSAKRAAVKKLKLTKHWSELNKIGIQKLNQQTGKMNATMQVQLPDWVWERM